MPQDVASNVSASAGAGAGNTSMGARSCAAHRACADLRLDGSCCPAADGTYLGCCDAAVSNVSLRQLEAASHSKLAKRIPAWCAELSEHARESSVSWPETCSSVLSGFLEVGWGGYRLLLLFLRNQASLHILWTQQLHLHRQDCLR